MTSEAIGAMRHIEAPPATAIPGGLVYDGSLVFSVDDWVDYIVHAWEHGARAFSVVANGAELENKEARDWWHSVITKVNQRLKSDYGASDPY
jgi:hypothetical protein